MKIVLISPPLYPPKEPYLAVPSLKAFLTQKGHDVVQKDTNLEFFNRILSRDYLSACRQDLFCKANKLAREKPLNSKNRKLNKSLKSALFSAIYVIGNIETAKRIIQKDNPKRGRMFTLARNLSKLWAISVINSGLDLVSLRYLPTTLNLWKLNMRYSIYSVSQVLEALGNKEENPFIDFYNKLTVPEILNEHPDIVGISINDFQQLIPGLTLASILKSKNIYVVIGGVVFSSELKISEALFKVCDSFVLGEGEEALDELAKQLKIREDLSNVPNLVWRDNINNKIVYNIRRHLDDLDSLPSPDFAGLPLSLYFGYFMGNRKLPLLVSKGCYWNKCSFCDITFKQEYKFKKAENVYQDIIKTINAHGARSFFFVGDSLDPVILREISELLIKNNVNIGWEGLVRFEQSFSEDFCKILRKSGCRKLYLGLESGSQKTLDSIGKGTDINSISKIMQNLQKAGIAVHLYVLVGFLGETREEAQRTIEFLVANRRIIDSPDLSLGIKTVEYSSSSVMFRKSAPYQTNGLRIKSDDSDLNARKEYTYIAPDGLAPDEMNKMIGSWQNLLVNKFYYYGFKLIIFQRVGTYNFFLGYVLLLTKLIKHGIRFRKTGI